MELADVKEYLRIDSDAEDALIENLLSTAVAYVRQAVDGYDEKIGNKDFKVIAEQCQRVLIVDMYENRNAYGQGHKDYGFVVRSMISQMQLWSAT